MYTDIYGGGKEASEAAKLRGLKREFKRAGVPRTKKQD
jgi:hypothetical protein